MTEYVATPTLLADLADELLGEATEGVVSPPERVYVSHGEPAYDCEQLTVHLVNVQPKLAAPPGSSLCAVMLTARYAVTLLRRVTTIKDGDDPIPTGPELHEQYMALAAEGWTLYKHLTGAWAHGELPADLGCGVVTWGALEPKGPAGGLAGWRIDLTYELT